MRLTGVGRVPNITRRNFLTATVPAGFLSTVNSDATELLTDTPQFGPGTKLSATLLAVGDIITHTPLLRSVRVSGRFDDYNFDPVFGPVTPLLRSGDWVIGNLETPLAGPKAAIRTYDGVKRGYTGYPFFNGPPSLASSLARAGFTLLSTANNHALDRWENGVAATQQALENAGIEHVGTRTTPDDDDRVCVVVRNGISLAFCAYTYGTNGIAMPPQSPWMVNVIDPDPMARDFDRARAMDADLIVCMLHFGPEYMRRPNREQRDIVHMVFDLGADIIIGSHPHVVQPVECRFSTGSDAHRTVVAYSMGNFLSNQHDPHTDLGAILRIKIIKRPPAKAVISSVDAEPTKVVNWYSESGRVYRIVSLRDIVDNGNDHGIPERLRIHMADELHSMEKHLGLSTGLSCFPG